MKIEFESRGRFFNRGFEVTGLHMAQIANKAILQPDAKIRWWWGEGLDINVGTVTEFMTHVTKYPIFIDNDSMIATRLWAYHDKNHQHGYTEFIDLVAALRTDTDGHYVLFAENGTIDGTDTVVPFFKMVDSSGLLIKTFGFINKPYESGKDLYNFEVDVYRGDDDGEMWNIKVDMKDSPYKSLEIARTIVESTTSFLEDEDGFEFGAIVPVSNDTAVPCPDFIKEAIETESKAVFNVYRLIGK